MFVFHFVQLLKCRLSGKIGPNYLACWFFKNTFGFEIITASREVVKLVTEPRVPVTQLPAVTVPCTDADVCAVPLAGPQTLQSPCFSRVRGVRVSSSVHIRALHRSG